MIALIVGTVLAVAALAFVLYPIFFATPPRPAVPDRRRLTSAPIPAATSENSIDEEIEAAVRAYREKRPVCAACGPRPEPDAVFCSNCGRYLSDRCAACGTPVVAREARYCLNCGNRFAA